MKLAIRNRVQVTWMLRHGGIEVNEIANQLAKKRFEHLFTAPEVSCGISDRVAK
jgi:ribonuclease HI